MSLSSFLVSPRTFLVPPNLPQGNLFSRAYCVDLYVFILQRTWNRQLCFWYPDTIPTRVHFVRIPRILRLKESATFTNDET